MGTMEFESRLGSEIAGKRYRPGRAFARIAAALVVLVVAAAAMAVLPRAEAGLVLLDEVNIGDPVTEAGRTDGWSSTVWTLASGGWGGFDPMNDPYDDDSPTYARAHNLRTVWAATEDDTGKWASVTMFASAQARLLQISALDGIGNDSFMVYVNGKLSWSYPADPSTNEFWVLHTIPVKDSGTIVVEIVATGNAWTFPGGAPGKTVYGQLGINFLRLYGVGGFDMYGYNYDARLFVGTYDGADRYLDGAYRGMTGDWVDDLLVMKWSQSWDDARFNGGTWDTTAWCTNHVVGDYYGDDGQEHQYTSFTKIVWIGPNGYGDTYPYLWSEFVIVEDIYNDPYGGYNGVFYKSNPGLGG